MADEKSLATTQEELDKVPATDPVEVVVEGAPVAEKEDRPDLVQDDSGRLRGKDGKYISKEEDPGTLELTRQLEEARRSNEQEKQRRERAEQQATQSGWQARSAQEQAEQAQYDAILNAIGATQAEAEAARHDMTRAISDQDASQQADAQWRLSQLGARLAQLEDGKTAYELRREQYQQQVQEQLQRRQQPRQPSTVDEHIATLPNLHPSERDWLRKHPETLQDNRRNTALKHHYFEAEKMGLPRGSAEYFKYLDDALGYSKGNGESRSSKPVSYSAPPSRESARGGESSTRITLSPQQREAAKISGITEVEYAKNLLQIQRDRKAGLRA